MALVGVGGGQAPLLAGGLHYPYDQVRLTGPLARRCVTLGSVIADSDQVVLEWAGQLLVYSALRGQSTPAQPSGTSGTWSGDKLLFLLSFGGSGSNPFLGTIWWDLIPELCGFDRRN